jgi:hypothetical protein
VAFFRFVGRENATSEMMRRRLWLLNDVNHAITTGIYTDNDHLLSQKRVHHLIATIDQACISIYRE